MRRALCCAVLLLSVGLGGCRPSETAIEAREAGIESLNAGSCGEAIQSFEEALEARKGSVGAFEYDVLKYRGEAEYRAGDFAAAAHTYEVLLQVDEERAEYYHLLAMSLAGAGDWSGAMESYNKGRDMNPEAAFGKEAVLAVGEACERQGEYERALTLYNTEIAERGADSAIYNRMGLCVMAKGEYETALQYFDQGAAAGDAAVLPSIRYNQAVVYEYMGDYSGALTAFQDYAARFGSTPEVEHEIAFLKTR